MQIYASQNNGAIFGSAWTTGRFIYNDPHPVTAGTVTVGSIDGNPVSDTNCPNIMGIFDWMSPAAKVMGLQFEELGDITSRQTRWNVINNEGVFTCPENTLLAPWYTGNSNYTSWPVSVLPSYNTAMLFLLERNNSTANVTSGATGATGRTVGRMNASGTQNESSNYNCRVSQVGDASRKIFIADGGRYSNPTTAIDLDLTFSGSNGGGFCDQGSPFLFSNSWNRKKCTREHSQRNLRSPNDCIPPRC